MKTATKTQKKIRAPLKKFISAELNRQKKASMS